MPKQQLEKLNTEMLACSKCALRAGCKQVVPGEGPATAEIMFIGEGPGKNEDEQGRPFVGAAGKFLSQLLDSVGMSREDVYIANVVKCRPPQNRDPLPQEVETCWPWLERQIEIIRPKIMVLLGRHSYMRFFPAGRISQDHGRALRKPFGAVGKIVFFPCYHPAAALYNGSLRSTLEQDFKKIPKILQLVNNEINNSLLKENSNNKNKGIPQQQSIFNIDQTA